MIEKNPALGALVTQRAARLRDGLARLGWKTLGSQSHILPIFIGDAAAALRLSETLGAGGFYAPAIRPPAVHAGQCRLRLSATAELSEDQIDRFLHTLGQAHE